MGSRAFRRAYFSLQINSALGECPGSGMGLVHPVKSSRTDEASLDAANGPDWEVGYTLTLNTLTFSGRRSK